MNGKLDSCSLLTEDVTEIMQRTYMGKVQNHHTFTRKTRQKKEPCGTFVTPPPQDMWYQCQSCYHSTLKRFEKKIPSTQEKRVYKKETPEQLQQQIKNSIKDFMEEINGNIEYKLGVLAYDQNIQVFYSPNFIEFKVDFKKQIPQSHAQLKPILKKILLTEFRELNKQKYLQGIPKQIRKLFIKQGQFGKTRIDIYIKIFHHEKYFGMGWCFMLSPWTESINNQQFQPSPYGDNLMELNLKFYGEVFAQEYNVHY